MKTKLSKIEEKEFSYIINVVASAANNTQIPIPFAGINWQNIISNVRYCGLSAIFANTVLGLPNSYIPDSVRSNLIGIKGTELLLDTNLNYEMEKLLKTFDKYKIKNAPVKGYFLKKEYPRSDFRSISDYDILFDEKQLDSVNVAFAELGYSFLRKDGENQYHFQKKPYMYVEMHKTLVHNYESFYPYLFDQLDKTVKREGYTYSYRLSPEDHYVYLLVHSSNHLRIAGLGIRMILDIYFYYKNHQAQFDMEYLNKRLELLNLVKFENRVREIAFKWFSDSCSTFKFDDFETLILLSGRLGRASAGTMINTYKYLEKTKSEGKGSGKLSYLISSVCPKKSSMIQSYPYLEKAPFLLPFSWCCMWFKRIFIKKNISIKAGLKNRIDYNQEDVNYYKDILKGVGFDDFSNIG